MKQFIITLIFLISIPVLGQNLDLTQKEGTIEIKMISHNIIRNEDDKIIQKANTENRPFQFLYLDTSGNLIKKVIYGQYHNRDLRLLGSVTIYKYENSKLAEEIEYKIEYGDTMRTEYFYDEKKQLIKKVAKRRNDTIIMDTYTYDSIGNLIKICFNDNTYYIRTFDDKGRILSLQQFWNNNLRWEYLYRYTKTSIIGNFKTYYDKDNHTKQEIVLYQNGKIKKVKELCISNSGLSNMEKYYYNKSGIITKIKYYVKYSCKEKDEDDKYIEIYKLQSYVNIETREKGKLTKQLVKQINEKILDNTY